MNHGINFLRNLRGWLYRRLPSSCPSFHRKRLTGFERRWNLETEGFTQAGFFRIFRKHFLAGRPVGCLFELAAADGLIGSLGCWMEDSACGWQAQAWEHRPFPLRSLRQNRPQTLIHGTRLTVWAEEDRAVQPSAVTTRGAREAAGVCRAIFRKEIQPGWVGIWNPTQRPIWSRRLRALGYRLELVYQRMEFYRRERKWGQDPP